MALDLAALITLLVLMNWATNWIELEFSKAIVVILVIAFAMSFISDQIAKLLHIDKPRK